MIRLKVMNFFKKIGDFFKNLFKKSQTFKGGFIILSFVMGAIVGVFILVSVALLYGTSDEYHALHEKEPIQLVIHRAQAECDMYIAKDALAKDMQTYIDSIAPNSSLNAMLLLNECIDHGVDPVFALAQGIVESHLGTAGMARKTGSVWNVKAYDGRSAEDMIAKGDGFGDPNDSIYPYLQLLTTSYMTNGKTEYDLMNKFITSNGARYASNPNYEVDLTQQYNKIMKYTNIGTSWPQFKKLYIIYKGWY